MGRTNFALMSLTAAVPGAFLVLTLVTGFLKHADKMPGALSAVAGITLLVAALLAAMPVGILLFGGPKSARAASPAKAAAVASKPEKRAKTPIDTENESFVADDDLGTVIGCAADDDWNEADSSVDFSESELMDSVGDEFEFDDTSAGEIDADFEFDDDEKR
ncbi:MAG: hypothetical protein AB7Q45_17425 [Planctomycetaceae bacterium]